MLNLIRNENMKIYRRGRTWIFFLLVFVFTCTGLLINKYDRTPALGDDWRNHVQTKLDKDRKALEQADTPESMKAFLEKEIRLSEYQLSRNIPPLEKSLWGGVANSSGLLAFVMIFSVVVAADMIAGEFGWGTIKLLLIRPAGRSRVLFSKYAAALMFSALLAVFLFGASLLVNACLYKFEQTAPVIALLQPDGQVTEKNVLVHAVELYGLKWLHVVMMATMAFTVSAIFRSSQMAIGLTMFLMFAGEGAAALLMRFSLGKYFLFANTDLTRYVNGTGALPGMSLAFSVGVLAVYYVLFMALSWGVFRRRDIAA